MFIRGPAVDPFVKFILHQPHLLNTDIVDTAEKRTKSVPMSMLSFFLSKSRSKLVFRYDFKHKKQFVCHPFI